MLSLRARLSGLVGEILRVDVRKPEARFTECLGLGTSVMPSTACPRDNCDGETGALGDRGAAGDLGEGMLLTRECFEGERESVRRISRMEAKPSIEVPCTCEGERRWTALPGE